MKNDLRPGFYRNLWKQNPVISQILGICSALPVTNRVDHSLVMGIGLIFVTAFSSLTLSA
ncbi:MAG: Rnf-Nqr domain containing protein, partial [Clostridia bacterium]